MLPTHNEAQIRYYSRGALPALEPAATPYVRRHLAETLRAARVERSHRILEVGCGMGRFTLPLAQAGYRVVGVELTPFLVDRLRAAPGGSKIDVHCCDVLDAPERVPGHFDRILGFMTLHHMPDLGRAFSAMARMLRPGGVMAFVEPNPFNPLYYLQITFTPGMRWAAEKGLFSIRRSVLASVVDGAGLADLAWRYYGFFPPFVANLPGATRVEEAIERLIPVKGVLPFQLLSARLPGRADRADIRSGEPARLSG